MTDEDVPTEGSKPEPDVPTARTPGQNKSGKKAGSEEAEPVTCDVADFPEGFWNKTDYLLHHPMETVESIRQASDLEQICRIFFAISLVMSAIYGAVMGATNLLQGSDMAIQYKFAMIFITAVKVPLLFLLTMVIVLPAIYVSNAFVGPGVSFRQMLTLLLATFAITGTVLASGATIAFFFALTSRSYHFIKLLHVFFFMCAGVAGLAYLLKCITTVAPSNGRTAINWLFFAWLLLYMFVGTQLAWVLRPFVGSPEREFQVFRPRKGNFYESVYHSLSEVIEERTRPRQKGGPEQNQDAPDSEENGSDDDAIPRGAEE